MVKRWFGEIPSSVLNTPLPAFTSIAFRNSETKLINIANDNQKIKVYSDSNWSERVGAIGNALMQKTKAWAAVFLVVFAIRSKDIVVRVS